MGLGSDVPSHEYLGMEAWMKYRHYSRDIPVSRRASKARPTLPRSNSLDELFKTDTFD